MRFLKPSEITTMFLFFLYILAVLLKASPEFLYSEMLRFLILSVSFIIPTYIFLKYKQQRISWDNILITLLILLLLSDTSASLPLMLSLGLLTFVFKSFFRIQRHPIFNPAAISLSFLYLFGLTTTWWGVSFSPRISELGISAAMFITLPVGLYIIKKYQKIPTLIATVLSYILISYLLNGSISIKILLEGTFAFYLLIMATEPKTTPLLDSQEWVYGILLGSSLVLWSYFKLPLPYLLNLLVLNVLFSIFKFVKIKRKI
jgi:Na+-transporting NADH:ubiquinone oxidoreductase subunit NqrB